MRAVLVLALATGCVLRDDRVHVTLRDPTRVAIAAHGVEILAEGAARGDIPASAYLHDPLDGSWVERDGTSIDTWCGRCQHWKRRTIVDSPELDFDGTAAEVVRFEGGMLHARYVFDDGRRGRRGYYPVPRIELDVVTPVDNVVAVDYTSHVSDRNGGPPDVRRAFEIGGIVFGAGFAALGAGIGALGIYHHEHGLDVAAGAIIGLGGAVIAYELYELTARDEHAVVAIPSGRARRTNP